MNKASMTDDALFEELAAVANLMFDGHVTVMKFTTNWRIGFGTPHDYCDICCMSRGKTFAEAATKALQNPERVWAQQCHCCKLDYVPGRKPRNARPI